MEQSLSKKTLDYPKWSPTAQNIFYTLLQSEVDWSICCNWAFARWTSEFYSRPSATSTNTRVLSSHLEAVSITGCPFLDLISVTSKLFISQNNPSFLVDASVKLWVVRFPGPDLSCGWRLHCRREWGLGRVEGWAGHTPRTNRPRPLGRPTIRARWEAAGGRPWAERPAQQTHRAGTDTCRKETFTLIQLFELIGKRQNLHF